MSGTLLYQKGRTYYHSVQNNLKSAMWDTPAILKSPTQYFYFKEHVLEVWSYGSLYSAVIINANGEPTPYERHGIKVRGFEVCGSSIDHQLVVEYEMQQGTYVHRYHNNRRFGMGSYDIRPLDYNVEWEEPAKAIIETIDEINQYGLDGFKELTSLRRRLCLARNEWKYEQEKDKEILDHALFFETCLTDTVFDEEKMTLSIEDVSEPSPLSDSVIDESQKLIQEIRLLERRIHDLRQNKATKTAVVRYYKKHLVSAAVKDTVDFIPFEQFECASGLESLIIPKSVNSIGNDAFNYSSLEKIIFLSPTPPKLEWGFPRPGKPTFKAKIIIPKGSRENYRLDSFSMWGDLQNQIQESDN
jgi:hypothetical protein